MASRTAAASPARPPPTTTIGGVLADRLLLSGVLTVGQRIHLTEARWSPQRRRGHPESGRYAARVQIAVTGSIAMDHLMTFPGRFAESLVVEHLDKISLSFLVEDLQIKRGGIAPNVCFGLAALGLNPLLVGSVGEDFGEYRAWLDRHGVLTWPIHVSQTKHTARFVCTTDADNAQIGSFYTGAMAEARQIELAPIADVVGGLDLVIISPNDPGGHAAAHRRVPDPRATGSSPIRPSRWPGSTARTSSD